MAAGATSFSTGFRVSSAVPFVTTFEVTNGTAKDRVSGMATLKRYGVRAVQGLLVLGILIQFIPGGRNHDAPPVVQEPEWDSPRTRELLVKACFDCHSNETKWPWYASVAPMSFFVQKHVDEGRRALNFSEWNRNQKHANESARAVLEGWMPLNSYLWLHGEAELTRAEKEALAKSLKDMFGMRKPAKVK